MLLNGKTASRSILEKIRQQALATQKWTRDTPTLHIIKCTQRADSQIYVKNKMKVLGSLGFKVNVHEFGGAMGDGKRIEALIQQLNQNDDCNGILVQSPIDCEGEAMITHRLLESVSHRKDVDGLTNSNIAALALNMPNAIVPCTPLGITQLLKYHKLDVGPGTNAVILGRSRIVGLPLMLHLNGMDASSSLLHSQSKDIAEYLRIADLVIVAVGKANLIKSHQLKQGSIIIDVGINRIADGRIVGDVDVEGLQNVVKAYSPVPGGVGPMTIAMLASNLWKLFCQQNNLENKVII